MVILLSVKFDTIKRKLVVILRKIIKNFNLLLPFSVLLIVLTYSISLLFFSSFYGFHLDNNGMVEKIYVDNLPLQLGDRILSINSSSFEEFINDPYADDFANQPKNSLVDFEIQRGDEIHHYKIQSQNFIFGEFKNRYPNIYLIGLVFWLIGTISFFIIRPRNVEWKVLISTCYLTAIWLTTGGMAIYKMFYAGMVFRVVFWISIPLYLLIHSLIGIHKTNLSKKMMFGLFSPFVILSILQIFQIIGLFSLFCWIIFCDYWVFRYFGI